MKKLLLSLGLSIFLLGSVFAQEEAAAPAYNNNFSFRLGAEAVVQPVLGDLKDYIGLSYGGGLKAEFDLPIVLPEVIDLGIPVSIYGFGNTIKDDVLSSVASLQLSTGFYVRINLANNNFVLQPELDYGMAMYFPKANPAYGNTLNTVYIDQIVQFGLGFCYVPQNVMEGDLEFTFTPLYCLSLEKEYLGHYLGAKLGVFLRLK